MKKILFTTLLAFLLTPLSEVSAQETKYDTIAYLFPKLTEGKFAFKDGNQLTTLFNYGYRQQDLLYYNAQTKEVLQVANLQDILWIRTGSRYFIPVMKGIGELIIYDDICLVYYKRLKIDEPNKSTSYGSTSTSSIQNTTTDRAMQSGHNPHITHYSTSDPNQRSLSEKIESGELRVVTQEDLYLSEIGDTKVVPLTKKNLLKKFPMQVDFIENYFAERKPDLQNRHDAARLVDLLNTMNK